MRQGPRVLFSSKGSLSKYSSQQKEVTCDRFELGSHQLMAAEYGYFWQRFKELLKVQCPCIQILYCKQADPSGTIQTVLTKTREPPLSGSACRRRSPENGAKLLICRNMTLLEVRNTQQPKKTSSVILTKQQLNVSFKMKNLTCSFMQGKNST